MTIAYLDTSALLKLVLDEGDEERVTAAIQRAGRICTSVISYVEARVAISRHFLDLGHPALIGEHQTVVDDFQALWADVNEVDVTPTSIGGPGSATSPGRAVPHLR